MHPYFPVFVQIVSTPQTLDEDESLQDNTDISSPLKGESRPVKTGRADVHKRVAKIIKEQTINLKYPQKGV